MPKDEFDFEDPLELNGVALLVPEDTTGAMADCFIEEFMRMGHSPQHILTLFRDPHYLGPNLAYKTKGEPFIRDLIVEVFARWGQAAAWGEPGGGACQRRHPPADAAPTRSDLPARADLPPVPAAPVVENPVSKGPAERP
ncbi:MAG TPA: hypothetical protein PKX23_20005 [Verrucomicrobiota bacterium]|nr:hypothetical protein [Verrucomicrobiota bacterium]HRT56101.1 hypothetical protein [Candidatus Paceibacterota bacterium]